MTALPEIALVFTPEHWVEELHRFFTDHGGARVRQLLVDPALVLSDDYETLVVSARWPALTAGLVRELHERGRHVLGVFDAEEPAARELLVRMQVDHVLERSAPPGEFVAALHALSALRALASFDVAHHAPAGNAPDRREIHGWIAVGGPGGAGATEVAVAIATRIERAVLVEVDEMAPSIAARLGLAPEPNLRSAIDAVEHGDGRLADALHYPGRIGIPILTGLAHVDMWAQIRPTEVQRVLRALAAEDAQCVVDVGSSLEDLPTSPRGRWAVARAVCADAGTLVAVGDASPVGVLHLIRWIDSARALAPNAPVVVVLNRAPRDQSRRTQLRTHVLLATRADALGFVPFDPKVREAAWRAENPSVAARSCAVTDVAADVRHAEERGVRTRAVG